jgi:hypothetical protein
VDKICYGESHLYRGELIRCQSDHNDYACSHGVVAMSGGDRSAYSPGARGRLWSGLVLSSIKWLCYLMVQALG